MELIAATKMRKAQASALAGRPYSTDLASVLSEIKSKIEKSKHPLLTTKREGKELVIIVSTDRGLTGGLNLNLFREVISRLHPRGGAETTSRSHPGGVSFIAIGKKATTFAAKSNYEMIASFESEEKLPLDAARILSKIIRDEFINGRVAKVTLLYPHFESTVKQVPRFVQILPIELNTQPTDLPSHQPIDLLFEPNADDILENILPHYILTTIYQILLESKASEHSARMIAMKNATDAAGDIVDDLTLTYNQARQEAITKELLDIVTAQKTFG